QFDSCDTLLTWVKREARARVTPYGFGVPVTYYERTGGTLQLHGTAANVDQSAPVPAGTPTSSAARTATGADYSATNAQVAGVDEPDMVKTDGNRIVALVDGKLRLLDGRGGTPKLLDTLTLDAGYSGQLMLDGDHVFVISTNGDIAVGKAVASRAAVIDTQPPSGRSLNGSLITQVTIDGDHLRIAGAIELDGSYVSARQIGDVARVVVRSSPLNGLGFVYPNGTSRAALANALATNRAAIDATTIADWLPHYTLRDADGTKVGQGDLVPCDAVRHPNWFSGFGVLDVVTLDLTHSISDSLRTAAGAAVLADGETVYASADHLFVATLQTPTTKPSALMPSPGVPVRPTQPTSTAFHEFDISDPTTTRYIASGFVDGIVLDQYSMDESNGLLRVATTTGSDIEPTGISASQVRVLATRGDELVEIGKVGGLGKGETIQSVRFVGNVAYVVTFRQTDPLYVVDLSDPAHPRVAGELGLLGFSAYLHPAGDGYILGIGQDATATGGQTGFQIALFDVRNPALPKRVAQRTIPGAFSEAQWDPHAFLWWAKSSLAIVPIEAPGSPAAVGYTVDTAHGTITERGRIEQTLDVQPPNLGGGDAGSSSGSSGGSSGGGKPNGTVIGLPSIAPYAAPILRSLVIGNHVYTVSAAGVIESDLDTLHTVATSAFGN
ncbi:MAG: hypothetical protein JWL83_823, partial [Actinomycetia bacterium]|nr:hypothetical protein [Actinomycetes bacterium]